MLFQYKDKITIWQFILLTYAATWLISPFLERGMIWRLLMLGGSSYFAFSCFYNNKNGSKRHFLCVVLLVIYIVFLTLIMNDAYQYRIGTIIFLSVSFCSYFIYNHEIPIDYLKIGIEYIMGICILSNIITLRQLRITPNICRLFAKNLNFEAMGYHAMRGTGGYGFIYTILLLLPFSLELTLFEKQDKKLRIISFICFLTSYILIFKAAYFLALLLSILTTFLYFVFKFPEKFNKKYVLLFIIFIILFFIFFDYFVSYVVQYIPIRSMQEKLLSLQELLNGSEELEDSEFSLRSERYWKALVNTLISPFFGWFTYRGTGNHSHLMDFSAQYGLLLLYGYVQLIINPLRKCGLFQQPASITCIVIFGGLTLLNTLAFAWGGIMLIFIPMYCAMIQKHQNEKTSV